MCPMTLCCQLCKMAKPIEILFRLWTQVGRMKHVLYRGHIGATWRIWFNHPCVAVMCYFVKLLWSLVCVSGIYLFFLSILSPKWPIECRVESCVLLSYLLVVFIKWSRQYVIKLCIVRTHTHCLYMRPICTGRMCGPYIPVHFLTPICTVHIYRCLKVHPYVWAVYTGRASVPYNSSTFYDSIVEKLRHYWCKVYWRNFCGKSKS